MSSSGDCAWQAHSFQGLVENISECQALKTAWQGHSVQGLVKSPAKCQALKTAWQAHSPQGLVESPAKCQALKTAWQAHSFHGLVEIISECQALEIVLGKLTPSRVWLKSFPNVKLRRLLDKLKLTPSSVWFNASPKAIETILLGRCCKYWPAIAPSCLVIPCSAHSPTLTGNPSM